MKKWKDIHGLPIGRGDTILHAAMSGDAPVMKQYVVEAVREKSLRCRDYKSGRIVTIYGTATKSAVCE